MLTLDEAITHSRTKAKELSNKAYAEVNKTMTEDEAYECNECAREHEQLAGWLEELKTRREADRWIPVSERLPDNAKHKGALCPRYQVSTKYGVTEGWYNPDTECWFVLVWYKYKSAFVEYEPDFESGDIACVIKGFPVIAWKPLPKPYESEAENESENLHM